MARTHKTLGEYALVSVTPLLAEETETSIVGSINDYGWDFHPDTEVELPQKVIEYLKSMRVSRYKRNTKNKLVEYEKKRYAVEKIEVQEQSSESTTQDKEGNLFE